MKQQGLFRKSGVKTRIAKLRDFCESNPDGSDFCEYRENSPYDVADLVKMYLRELPEPLMTLRLSSTFTTIFIDVPPQYRLRALQSGYFYLETRSANFWAVYKLKVKNINLTFLQVFCCRKQRQF